MSLPVLDLSSDTIISGKYDQQNDSKISLIDMLNTPKCNLSTGDKMKLYNILTGHTFEIDVDTIKIIDMLPIRRVLYAEIMTKLKGDARNAIPDISYPNADFNSGIVEYVNNRVKREVKCLLEYYGLNNVYDHIEAGNIALTGGSLLSIIGGSDIIREAKGLGTDLDFIVSDVNAIKSQPLEESTGMMHLIRSNTTSIDATHVKGIDYIIPIGKSVIEYVSGFNIDAIKCYYTKGTLYILKPFEFALGIITCKHDTDVNHKLVNKYIRQGYIPLMYGTAIDPSIRYSISDYLYTDSMCKNMLDRYDLKNTKQLPGNIILGSGETYVDYLKRAGKLLVDVQMAAKSKGKSVNTKQDTGYEFLNSIPATSIVGSVLNYTLPGRKKTT